MVDTLIKKKMGYTTSPTLLPGKRVGGNTGAGTGNAVSMTMLKQAAGYATSSPPAEEQTTVSARTAASKPSQKAADALSVALSEEARTQTKSARTQTKAAAEVDNRNDGAGSSSSPSTGASHYQTIRHAAISLLENTLSPISDRILEFGQSAKSLLQLMLVGPDTSAPAPRAGLQDLADDSPAVVSFLTEAVGNSVKLKDVDILRWFTSLNKNVPLVTAGFSVISGFDD